jgi:hypothetical protein
MKILSNEYNCSISTIYYKLKNSNNINVINKLSKKNSNIIEIKNNYIYLYYKENVHTFDYTELIHNKLINHYWAESNTGHLQAKINKKTFKAYWFVLGLPHDGKEIDHIDGNPRNNRNNNLRFATRSENNINARLRTNNTSGYKGVSYAKKLNKYHAYININKKRITIGYYFSAEEAYEARMKTEIKIYGEFARIRGKGDVQI